MELLSSNINKIQETETPKKFLIFQETEILKKLLIFRETEPFSTLWKNFLYFRKRKPRKKSLYFRKQKPPKNPYTSGKGTFLYFRKRNFLIFK